MFDLLVIYYIESQSTDSVFFPGLYGKLITPAKQCL